MPKHQCPVNDRPQRGPGRFLVWALLLLSLPLMAYAEERFPPPEFRGGYAIPTDQFPAPAARYWDFLDTGLLVGALAMAAWLGFYKRSRRGMFLLTIFAVAWFGFVRKGCVCPIGSIQNVTEAAFTGLAIPWTVAAFFMLPLVVALFFGRVFCSSVCPLGAIQDLFTRRGTQQPTWVDASFGLLAYLYLGLAVMYAALSGPYIICEYDPFVSMFRLGGPSYMLVLGGILLLIGVVVGRPYCRFFCPYGVLLRLLSRFSWRKIRITPAECINCRLCEKSCPFGAIKLPTHQEVPRPVLTGKGALVASLVAAPLIVAALAWLGYLSGDGLSTLHRDVKLAQEVAANERVETAVPSDALKLFLTSGRSSDELYAQVDSLRGRFRIGASLVGVWMGVVIGSKLITFGIRRRRQEYTADPGACLACARCFEDCPVELKRRGVIMELPVVPEYPTS